MMWEPLLRRWYAYRERLLDDREAEVRREEMKLNMLEIELFQRERELTLEEERRR